MQVGIGKRCDPREVQAALAAYFPCGPVCVYPSIEVFQEYGTEGSINGILHSNPSEFPMLLDAFPDPLDRRGSRRKSAVKGWLSLALAIVATLFMVAL
jgi:hypothetical protein